MFVATCAAVIGTMAPADAGKISATRNWTGNGSAYTSLYADVRRDCGFWSCTSWVTGVRHYSRDWAAKSNFVVYPDESQTIGWHENERTRRVKQMTVRAS